MSTFPAPANDTVQSSYVFGQQQILHTLTRNTDDEQLALTYLNKKAPDLIGMVMGHIL